MNCIERYKKMSNRDLLSWRADETETPSQDDRERKVVSVHSMKAYVGVEV